MQHKYIQAYFLAGGTTETLARDLSVPKYRARELRRGEPLADDDARRLWPIVAARVTGQRTMLFEQARVRTKPELPPDFASALGNLDLAHKLLYGTSIFDDTRGNHDVRA